MQPVNVVLPKDQPVPSVITILQGEAPEQLPINAPTAVNVTGVLSTPRKWLDRRKEMQTIDVKAVHIVANYTSKTILAVINERDEYKDRITGVMKINPELEALAINTKEMFTEKELLDVLTFLRRYFTDRNKYEAIIVGLKNFEVKVETALANVNDNKGHIKLQKAYDIKHELHLGFDLNMPVFMGAQNCTFSVDVQITMNGSQIAFMLQSVDLHQLIQEEVENALEDELKLLEPIYTVVRQY